MSLTIYILDSVGYDARGGNATLYWSVHQAMLAVPKYGGWKRLDFSPEEIEATKFRYGPDKPWRKLGPSENTMVIQKVTLEDRPS